MMKVRSDVSGVHRVGAKITNRCEKLADFKSTEKKRAMKQKWVAIFPLDSGESDGCSYFWQFDECGHGKAQHRTGKDIRGIVNAGVDARQIDDQQNVDERDDSQTP